LPTTRFPTADAAPAGSAPARAFDANRVVVARRDLIRGIEVVDDIDTADEGDFAVDHRQLAVQTTQAMAAQAEARDVGSVDHRLHTRGEQCRLQAVGELPGAEAVDQHADRDAPSSSACQRRSDRLAGRIVLENVAFEVNIVLCAVDRPDQLRKVLGAAVQQGQAIAGQELSGHGVDSGSAPASPAPALLP
jgi:hypothetical protein